MNRRRRSAVLACGVGVAALGGGYFIEMALDPTEPITPTVSGSGPQPGDSKSVFATRAYRAWTDDNRIRVYHEIENVGDETQSFETSYLVFEQEPSIAREVVGTVPRPIDPGETYRLTTTVYLAETPGWYTIEVEEGHAEGYSREVKVVDTTDDCGGNA